MSLDSNSLIPPNTRCTRYLYSIKDKTKFNGESRSYDYYGYYFSSESFHTRTVMLPNRKHLMAKGFCCLKMGLTVDKKYCIKDEN